MGQKSIGKKILGDWNTKTVVTIAIGAALYGVLMVYGGIPVFTNTNLSTALLVPVVTGALVGAVPTAITLFLGNVIADLIGGWGLWFDWSIGNGVMGFFIGLLPVYGANITEGIFKVKHAVLYCIVTGLGTGLALVGVIPVLTAVLYGGELSVTFAQGFVAWGANALVLLVAGVPILALMANRFKARSNLQEASDDEATA